MIEEYTDMRVAYDRAKHLNKIAGRNEYFLTATTDGWAVRRHSGWNDTFLRWRREFYRFHKGTP